MKVLCVFGTRPEAIKFAPIIRLLRQDKFFETIVCTTSQHVEMLNQVLSTFNIKRDFDLKIMRPNQTLTYSTAEILASFSDVLSEVKPDWVLVQGDATSAFAAALASYYFKTKIGHVEAGLRTWDKYAPFPEEFNRCAIALLADANFAPTEGARENLIHQNVPSERIWITGNTGIDALQLILRNFDDNPGFASEVQKRFQFLSNDKRLVLVTAHRRESFGEKFEEICNALHDIGVNCSDAQLVYPVHLNPNALGTVERVFGHIDMKKGWAAPLSNLFLTEPVDYGSMAYLLKRAYVVLTDSGGLQEEAPTLGKPVLVMRDVTERPEGVAAGVAKIVGRSRESIAGATIELLTDSGKYAKMARQMNLYGDGHAAERVLDALKSLSRPTSG
jgi:UDP-N-acetylglucosamine 2-epimerase (non-hydrolysing)